MGFGSIQTRGAHGPDHIHGVADAPRAGAKIAHKALQDDAFRAEFTAAPAAAFVKFVKYEGVSGAQLSRFVVHEE